MSEEDLNEVNIEIIRNKLWKVRTLDAASRVTSYTKQAYLEDFYHFTQKLGGATAEVMKDILQFEADRRTINITINSIGTELQKEDRGTLYPNFGMLSPEGTEKLMKADDQEQVKSILENYQVRNPCFAQACRERVFSSRCAVSACAHIFGDDGCFDALFHIERCCCRSCSQAASGRS